MNKRTPFFTIAIPTYDRSKYLALAIQSVLKQDFKNYEIIISDNYSTDDTAKIVKKFQRKTKKIRYYKLNKHTIYGQINFINCFKKAKGKYFFILADDDLILRPDTLSYIYKLVSKHKSGFIKIGAIFYRNKFEGMSDIYKGFLFKNKIEIIKPNDANLVQKTINKALEFASGTVYLLDNEKIKMLNEKDILYYHLPYTYQLINDRGALFIGNHFVLGRFFVEGHEVYNFLEPAFSLDTQLDIVKNYIKEKEKFEEFDLQMRRAWLLSIINMRIGAPRSMLFRCILKIIKKDKHIPMNIIYYFLASISLLTPRIILRLIKKQFTRRLTIDVNNVIRNERLMTYLLKIGKINIQNSRQ